MNKNKTQLEIQLSNQSLLVIVEGCFYPLFSIRLLDGALLHQTKPSTGKWHFFPLQKFKGRACYFSTSGIVAVLCLCRWYTHGPKIATVGRDKDTPRAPL